MAERTVEELDAQIREVELRLFHLHRLHESLVWELKQVQGERQEERVVDLRPLEIPPELLLG